MRIIVMGYIVRGPLGGMTWHHLNYVLGFASLGHDVYFIEDSDDWASCYDPSRQVTDTDPTFGLAYTHDVFTRVGFGDRWAYHDAHRAQWHGPLASRAVQLCRSADLVLNISGINPLRDWIAPIPRRVLIDTDPVFTQIRHLADPAALDRARLHTHFLTFGENIPSPGYEAPHDGLPWRATRQPLALEHWPSTPLPDHAAYTTVMQWDSYQERVHDGKSYGMKSRSFEHYLDLPRRIPVPMELAMGGGAPVDRLHHGGWGVRNSIDVSADPWSYQRYLQQSAGEFSIAKHGYVASRCGWFSERTACYLATGRPVVVQDTGFRGVLPVGEGLLAFSTPDEAVAAMHAVLADPQPHARAARRIAESHFSARVVLPRLLADVGC